MRRAEPATKKTLLVLALTCLVSAAALAGHAGWMRAKAVLAQYLIAGSWQQTLAGQRQVKPWSWADTWPVARMTTPAGEELYVLAGLTGASMAFGPATPVNGSRPGEPGTTVIAGHKDTVFRFLEDVKRGQTLQIQRADGRTFRYRIADLDVVDSRTATIPVQHRRDELLLITCYPFGAGHYDSPLRYLVTAERL